MPIEHFFDASLISLKEGAPVLSEALRNFVPTRASV